MTYRRSTLELHSGRLEVVEGVSGRGRVDGADHAHRAMRAGEGLLAEEPDGLRLVGDRQVPGRECCRRGKARRDEDVAGVETVRERVARVGEGRLGDGVVSWHARVCELDDVAVVRGHIGRVEDEEVGASATNGDVLSVIKI